MSGSEVAQAAHEWRRNEVQAMGAAISTRNWHAMETMYNRLRDKMDAAGCWHAPRAPTPPAAASEVVDPLKDDCPGVLEDGRTFVEHWRSVVQDARNGHEMAANINTVRRMVKVVDYLCDRLASLSPAQPEVELCSTDKAKGETVETVRGSHGDTIANRGPDDVPAIPTDEAIVRAYFERGFIAAGAWAMTKRDGVLLSDDVIEHAWAHRDEGMDAEDMLPTPTATHNAEVLREALEPFARRADRFDGIPPAKYFGDTDALLRYYDNEPMMFTLGQCRAARSALDSAEVKS